MNILVNALKGLLGIFGTVLDSIFSGLRDKQVLDRAVELAQLHVAAIDGTDADNEAKRKAVQDSIVADLKAEGLKAKSSLVNLAIELAVVALQAQAGKL